MHKRRGSLVQLGTMSFAVLVACSSSSLAAIPGDSAAGSPKCEQAKNQEEQPSEEGQRASGVQQTVQTDAAQKTNVERLKEQLAQEQKEIDRLRLAVQEQKELLEHLQEPAQAEQPPRSSMPAAPNLGQVASASPIVPAGPKATTSRDALSLPAATLAGPAANPQREGGEETSPLQLRIGSAYLIPVGFMDFTSVWRSHDGGSGIGTNFASIPYGSSTFQGNLSEFRLSMQNSRIGFRVDAMVKGAHVIGYMESDFLGNNPTNVAVSSNSNTLRSRLYWADVSKDRWEVMGGQTWSLITPGRTGISPLPGNLFYTQNIDVNYQLGLVWGRIPELRFVYHPSDKAALAVALDSPEQYVGGSAGGGLITFPSALSSAYSGELNVGANTLAVPNLAPDVIAKLALDPNKRFHFEVGGVERNFKVWNPTSKTDYTAQGGGGFVNLGVEVFKDFRLLTNNFWSDGGGRYIFGQAPDLIAHADGSISLIHSSSTVSGAEYTHKNWLLYGYYGGLYVQRNVAVDTNRKLVGYGYTGAPSGQNKSVQEGTFGFTDTFWKDAKYGALALMGQYSYIDRNPWFIASGQPKDAHLNMVFFNLRYTLPGSAPAMK